MEVHFEGHEEVHAEIEDFGQASTNAMHVGLARAGTEDTYIE